MIGKLSKPAVFLFSEFVIIVLGVLVALGVDNWNSNRQDEEVRRHLIGSLLADLREDTADYEEFVTVNAERHDAANFIIERSADDSDWTDAEYEQAREALYKLGGTARLETVDVTFREMSALGSGATIEDSRIRLKISYYYGLARDRADLNDLLASGILRYRASLEELGVSYVDRQDINVDAVIADKRTMAIIRELRYWATVVRFAADLQEANENLIAELESLHAK